MRVAFDADVLIYAAALEHPLTETIWAILNDTNLDGARYGSVLLLPELLIKPTRSGGAAEVRALLGCLARLELVAIDDRTASLAVTLGASYGLRALDALHLSAAISVGADAFLTNNSKDFKKGIAELSILYPSDF